MTFSKRVLHLKPSGTIEIMTKAKDMLHAGIDLINLGPGEPDFITPEFINKYASQKILSGEASFYTQASGIPEIKSAIAAKEAQLYGQKITSQQVAVTTGAKLGLFALMQALVDTDDIVCAPVPYWASYAEQVHLNGGIFKAIQVKSDVLKLTRADLEELDYTPKVLILNSPNNPSGVVYDRETLSDIIKWCDEHDVYLILDEIYGRLTYNGTHFVSGLELHTIEGSKLIIVDGVSKAFSMTGWRIGWVIADKTVIAQISKLLGHLTSNPTTASQFAALEALSSTESDSAVEHMRQAFEKRLNLTYPKLKEVPYFELPDKPEGAFYFFIRVQKQGLAYAQVDSTKALALKLLDEAHVALTPGEAFGMPGYVRISYATSQSNLDAGITRLKKFFGEE